MAFRNIIPISENSNQNTRSPTKRLARKIDRTLETTARGLQLQSSLRAEPEIGIGGLAPTKLDHTSGPNVPPQSS